MNSRDIRAGAGEKTFVERYRLKVTLPMQEAEFLRILRRSNLDYEVYGEKGSKRGIPRPRHLGVVDMAKIQRVYQIYGDVDRAKRVSKVYWAFIDMANRVVYIENNFSYTGP